MKKIDYTNLKFYRKLGFKSGVEIHQQLLTEKKLFCNCPAGLYSNSYDVEILRHMRPTLSELGEYDGCALMEFKTRKNVIYRLSRESVCTYEMDDTPPFLVNQVGLDIVIEIALLLNCSLVDEMHISRKQYLDGSIPTGFQRTAVVGINGWIPYKGRKIRISHICYEEDACREISDEGHQIIFKTDRLGMPLIEVITHPDMRTPQEVREVVTEIGRLMRVTGKVRRGIGSVRQDVNVSVTGGDRVEIKGVPQVGLIPALVHYEALRQKSLLDIRKKLVRKKVTADNLKVFKKDLTKALAGNPPSPRLRKGSSSPPSPQQVSEYSAKENKSPLKNKLNKDHVLGGIKICGLAGALKITTQPGKTFADEIAGRIRVIACLDKMPNYFHTDNYPDYAGSKKDLAVIRKELKVSKNDVGVIVWGSQRDVETALKEIRLRVVDLLKGIPNETRQPLEHGITDFERILPGPNRMYPDTDSPPTKITEARVQKIRDRLPETPGQKEKRYLKMGIPDQIARQLAVSPRAAVAEQIVADLKVDPTLVGVVLTQRLRSLKRQKFAISKISDQKLFELFKLYARGVFHQEVFSLIMEELAKKPSVGVKEIIKKSKLAVVPAKKIKSIIKQVIKDNSFASPKAKLKGLREKKIDFYAGKVMSKFRGMVDGQALRKSISCALR
ncbi:MAG: Glu-tRNA(Gln) amidotransferase subunit GatE [Planctomycetes bacterium]|nr:Glu-tRNA(Gln) amidotransferase subunit GatE [Planctomycetota bacterium]